MMPRNKNKGFSEPMRNATFKNEPALWEKQSELAVAHITAKINDDHCKFNSIYEIAREDRIRAAKLLNHGEEFGEIRTARAQDIYKSGDDSMISNDLFKLISDLLYNQERLFDLNVDEFVKDHMVSSVYTADDWVLSFYSFADPETWKETITSIKTWWPNANINIYNEILQLMNPSYENIKQISGNDDELLFKLGLMAYDLSRLNLLSRGSAAVTLWIICALGKRKIEDFNVPHICGMPFDIYAQMQLNRYQYAVDFAKSIKPDFKEAATYMTLTLVERRFLKIYIEKISVLVKSDPKAEIQEIKAKLERITNGNWISLSAALNALNKEIIQLSRERQSELTSQINFLPFFIDIVQNNSSTIKQKVEGYLEMDDLSFMLTNATLDAWLKNQVGIFPSLEKIFINRITGKIQEIALEIEQKNKNELNLIDSMSKLKRASTVNPLQALIEELRQIGNKEWSSISEALNALYLKIQTFLDNPKVDDNIQKSFSSYHGNLKLIIDKLQGNQTIDVLVLDSYRMFANPPDALRIGQISNPKV